MESFKFSCVFVNSLWRRRFSITSQSRFEMNETHWCDADIVRCFSIPKLIFEPATYDAVTHLAGVHLHMTTKPEHAKSRDTRAWVSRLSDSLHETDFQWFSFVNSSLTLVLYASLGLAACIIEEISTGRQQRRENIRLAIWWDFYPKSSKMSKLE